MPRWVPTSTIRFELELFVDPTTSKRSARGATPLDGDLSVLGRVADVFRRWALNRGEPPFQHGDDGFRLVEAERGLGEVGDILVLDLYGLGFLHARHDSRPVGRFADGSDDLVVIAMTDQNNAAVSLGEPDRLQMHFRNERTGGINDPKVAFGGRSTHCRRHTVRTIDQDGAPAGTSSTESTNTAPRDANPLTTKRLWTISLRTKIGGTVDLQSQFHDIDRPNHARAESLSASAAARISSA